MKEYNPENIPLAKTLRKNMTRHERKLWYEFLRNYRPRFQRQKAIGNYIADFYCAKAHLIIEVDGIGHDAPPQIVKDSIRTAELEKMNLTVIRITNLFIDKHFHSACQYIHQFVEKTFSQT